MKKTLAILICLFAITRIFAVETYITFNPKNCLSCVSGIYQLCKEDKIKSISIVLSEEYKNDTNDLNKLYEFDKFPKLNLVFSDSLYNTLSKLEYEAELIIYDKQKELYRANIKQVVLDDKLLALYASSKQIDSICSPFALKQDGFCIYDFYMVMYGKYMDNSVIHTPTGVEKPIVLTDSIVIDLYKLLYKDSFSKKYPVIQEMITRTPTYKPHISDLMEWDKEHLMLQGSIKDYRYNKEGDSVFMRNRPAIMKYKFSTKKVIGIYSLDNTMPADFDLWNLHISDSKYYGMGYDTRKQTFQLLEFNCHEQTKTFSFKRDTKVARPSEFSQRGVSSVEHNTILIRGNLLCFIRDDKITLLNSGKQITIPFKDYATSHWKAYEIRDLHEDEMHYYILYIYNKEFHVMRMRKDTQTMYDIVVGNTSTIYDTKLKFYNSGNKIICQPNNSGCFYMREVGFKE